MKRLVIGALRRLAYVLSIPVILSEYFQTETGREYGIDVSTKVTLALKMARNYRRIPTGSHVIEHLIMATKIMRIPRIVEGSVVECGSFKGGSAANLSLVCALCDRQLEICDSFAGLPEPFPWDSKHIIVNVHQVHTYSRGAWRGALADVKENITRFGNVKVCNFHAGYFAETLPAFRKKVVFAFLDVDLKDSLETCIKYLWPLLQDGCYLFTHEAQHMEIASVFFSGPWWSLNANCTAPGLIGAGNGLGLLPAMGGYRSDLAYTVKTPPIGDFTMVAQTGVF